MAIAREPPLVSPELWLPVVDAMRSSVLRAQMFVRLDGASKVDQCLGHSGKVRLLRAQKLGPVLKHLGLPEHPAAVRRVLGGVKQPPEILKAS